MKTLLTVLLTGAAYASPIIYTDSDQWNAATDHHVFSNMNNGNTGQFEIKGSALQGYANGSAYLYMDPGSGLKLTISLDQPMYGMLLGVDTELRNWGTGVCATTEYEQIGCFGVGQVYDGAWGFTTEQTFTTLTLSAAKLGVGIDENWTLDWVKAATRRDNEQHSSVPEPGTWVLGIAGLAVSYIRRRTR